MENRECGNCSVCCGGWIKGTVRGYDFYPGKPCKFSCKTGCSIYDERPEYPCKVFNCVWKLDNTLPDSMQPNQCGLLLTHNELDGIPFIRSYECGKVMDVKSFSNLVQYCYTNRLNLLYQLDGGWFPLGSPQFVEKVIQKFS